MTTPDKTASKILKFITENGRASKGEILAKLGLSDSSYAAALPVLRASEAVEGVRGPSGGWEPVVSRGRRPKNGRKKARSRKKKAARTPQKPAAKRAPKTAQMARAEPAAGPPTGEAPLSTEAARVYARLQKKTYLRKQQVLDVAGVQDGPDFISLKAELVDAGLASAIQGRHGGLALPETDEETEALEGEVATALEEQERADTTQSELEKGYYDLVERFVKGNLDEEHVRVTADARPPGRKKWEVPDLLAIRYTSLKALPVVDVTVIAVEVKLALRIDGILQSAAHNRFAHYSYLVAPVSKNDIEDGLLEIAADYGIGVALIRNAGPSGGKAVHLIQHPRRVEPRASEVDRAISDLWSNPPDLKKMLRQDIN